MIKAVFFDLYQTLVSFEPPREEIQAKALQEYGIEASPDAFRRPLSIADEFIYQEIARLPFSRRSKEEQAVLWAKYERIVLKEAGVPVSDDLIRFLLQKMHQTKMKTVPFADVIPALTDLKKRGIILGLISNVERDISPLLKETGLEPLLDVVVTSQDAGVNKPNPEIFHKVLRRAGVKASEAIYVGDQYQIDILGAQKAGMKGILLDRNGYYADITDCPRIQSLSELPHYLTE